jgi:hypothetical protein
MSDDITKVTPSRPSASALVEALMALHQEAEAFREAVCNAPSYTGQHTAASFYAAEQEAYCRAVDRYEDAVVASVKAAGSAESVEDGEIACLQWQASWTACGRGTFFKRPGRKVVHDAALVTCEGCLKKIATGEP